MSTPKQTKDTPTVAAAKRVLAAAKASLQAGGRGPAPRVYQREACESAPRLARRVLALSTFAKRFAEALYQSDNGHGSGALHELLREIGGRPYDPEEDPRYGGGGGGNGEEE